jgi:hypothetical protein
LVFSPQRRRRERWGWTAEDLSVSLLNSLWFVKTFLFLSLILFGLWRPFWFSL